jgi:hypothetical protein
VWSDGELWKHAELRSDPKPSAEFEVAESCCVLAWDVKRACVQGRPKLQPISEEALTDSELGI